jgi:hypothetical protein
MFGRSFLGGTGGGSTGVLDEGEEQLKEIIAKSRLSGELRFFMFLQIEGLYK